MPLREQDKHELMCPEYGGPRFCLSTFVWKIATASPLQQLEGNWLKDTEPTQASFAGGAGVFTLDHHSISGSKQEPLLHPADAS